MDDPNMHAYGEDGPTDAEIGRQWRENSSLEKWFPITAKRLAALEAENAALKREAHAWWTAARDATVAERERCAQRVALHSQYPIQTDYDRGYDKARKDAAETLRNMSTYVLTYAPDRPSTPVGWSDTDWLKHLEEIRQNEAAYARGPLPERGWD